MRPTMSLALAALYATGIFATRSSAQEASDSTAQQFFRTLLDATEQAGASRRENGPRFVDTDRVATLLAHALGGPVDARTLRYAIPAGYRDARDDDARECLQPGRHPCRIREDGVLLTVDSLVATPGGLRVVLTWRDNAPIPEFGWEAVEWEMAFARRGGGWVLVDRRVRRKT